MLERPPQPLDEDVVHPTTAAIHGDLDPCARQRAGEGRTGELAALVGVENLRRAVPCQSVVERSEAERGIHCIGDTPRQNRTARPVDDGDEIKKAAADGQWSKKRERASPPRTVRAPFSAYGSLFKLGPWP